MCLLGPELVVGPSWWGRNFHQHFSISRLFWTLAFMAGAVTSRYHQQPWSPHLSENHFYHHGCMSLKRSIPLPYVPSRNRKRNKEEGGREEEREGRGRKTKCDIWKPLLFPADFHLCLLCCHVIISNSKEDWEIFLDKHIASLNKIKVLWVRKKKKMYSRWEAGSILGKQQSTMEA